MPKLKVSPMEINNIFEPKNIVAEVTEKNKKVLPVFFPSLIHTYLNYSYQLAVILAYPETYDWFFSNYIQICSSFLENNYMVIHFLPTDREALENQLYLDISHLNEDFVDIKNNIVEKVRGWLDKNYYVGICVLESEIPGTFLHQIGLPHPHTQFIFGYDLPKKHFRTINFDSEQNFSMLNIGFDTLSQAFSSKLKQKLFAGEYHLWKNVRYPIKLIKFMGECNYHFDIQDIYLQLREYCAGIAPDLKYRNWCVGEDHNYMKDKATQWGIRVNDNLSEYFVNIVQNKREQLAGNPVSRLNPEYIPFHGFWEHKKIMTGRITYLQNKGFLDPLKKFPEQYYPVEHKANILRIMVLKYLMKVNDSKSPRDVVPEQEGLQLIHKVHSQLGELRQIETMILESIMNDLKNG